MKKNINTSVHVNVAPLIDVLLVLIIILMITTFVGNNGIEVDLPKTSESKIIASTDEPIILSIDKNLKLNLDGNDIAISDLSNTIFSLVKKKNNNTIYLKCDKDLSYQDVLQIMMTLASIKTVKVALISDVDDKEKLK